MLRLSPHLYPQVPVPPAGHRGSLSTVSPHQHIRSGKGARLSLAGPQRRPAAQEQNWVFIQKKGLCVATAQSTGSRGHLCWAWECHIPCRRLRLPAAPLCAQGCRRHSRGTHPSPTPRPTPGLGEAGPWRVADPKSQGDPGLRASTHSFRGVAKRHSTLPRRVRFAGAWSA